MNEVAPARRGVAMAPLELYHQPANLFVAGFIGSPRMNFLPVTATLMQSGSVLRFDANSGGGTATVSLSGSGRMTLGLRPEHVAPQADGPIEAQVDLVEQLGEYALYHMTAGDTAITMTLFTPTDFGRGDVIRLGFDPSRAHLFDGDGTAISLARCDAA